MSDGVATNVIINGRQNYVANFTNISDGTGEAAVKKVDISTLVGTDGVTVPISLAIMEVEFVVSRGNVRIFHDATTDSNALNLAGSGFISFTDVGGLPDPKASGYTGDIMFTTNGMVSGDTYSIKLTLKKSN
jgi:hypothetical protein